MGTHTHNRVGKAEQVTRLKQFSSALKTAQKFGFSIAEVAALINLTPRTVFRILATSRPVEHEDLIQVQTVALTLLKIQMTMIKDPSLDMRKVVP